MKTYGQNFIKKCVVILSILAMAQVAFAKGKKARSTKTSTASSKTINIDQQFGNLGSNEEIIRKARALQPNNTMKIVQKRAVDRDLRLELGLNYGYVSGGDTYISTQNLGASVDFHITPRWSIGARYIDGRNSLTAEGERRYSEALAKQNAGESNYVIPSVDYPLRTYLAVVNFYPIYGKVSWFESGVSQFDFYLLAGAGQVELGSGSSAIYTGGVGMGMWWNNWFSSRLEARYQNYNDRVSTGERSIDSMVFQVGIGFLL